MRIRKNLHETQKAKFLSSYIASFFRLVVLKYLANLHIGNKIRAFEVKQFVKAAQNDSRLNDEEIPHYSNFFTFARFGPDTIFIFALLTLGTLALCEYGLFYLAASTCGTLFAIFAAESVEVIHQSRPQQKKIVGARCLIVRSVSLGSRGVVKLYEKQGKLDPEFWSGESDCLLEEGATAMVVGSNGIILQIAPLENETQKRSHEERENSTYLACNKIPSA